MHGLVTFYTLFVIDLASRRVQMLDSTRHPDALFMQQITRALVFADDGALAHHRVLICDRDAMWSRAVRDRLTAAGLQVIQTPYRAPNATLTPSGSCARSGRNAWIASCRWVSDISARSCPSSS